MIISTHCHDDLGLAVANSLAGVRAGARQVECTINGIGERAGNAALEEIVMALHTRHAHFGLDTGIQHGKSVDRRDSSSQCTGLRVPPNKAIVGGNAFAHEAGIHQDGMLKHRQTYEIMSAEHGRAGRLPPGTGQALGASRAAAASQRTQDTNSPNGNSATSSPDSRRSRTARRSWTTGISRQS